MLPIYTIEQKEQIKDRLLNRADRADEQVRSAVRNIIDDVREKGDAALFAYTMQLDGAQITQETIRVTQAQIDQAYRKVDSGLVGIVKQSARNIWDFHQRQKRESWEYTQGGKTLGQLIRPLERVGVYVPGGKAAYPSSVLMNIIPAKVAGVDEIIMVTPPQKDGRINPLTLIAAREAGADMILKIGGAQAVAALAYGTQSVPKVDKITGPGNIYVATAKKEVFGQTGIDMIAGPSEVLIIADGGANPRFIAADLLSQAEHDEMAACVLITTDAKLAAQTKDEIAAQLEKLPKKQIARQALEGFGTIVIVKDLKQAFELANEIAPEHLELLVDDPKSCLPMVKNAGAVFLGEYSPEPLGDYFAGPNHVLPTNGTARFFSPLNVDDFIKKTSIVCYDKKELKKSYQKIQKFAEAEGLDAHARSVTIRFEDI